jgi:hypothetical protein
VREREGNNPIKAGIPFYCFAFSIPDWVFPGDTSFRFCIDHSADVDHNEGMMDGNILKGVTLLHVWGRHGAFLFEAQ